MPEQRTVLNRSDVKSRLPKLHEHLSRANSDRLDTILPLFRLSGNTRANLGACLDAIYADKQGWQKKQAEFRQFRQHIKKAFEKAGLGIELTVDTRKRTLPSDRECWFTGPPINRTAERVEQFSLSAASDVGTVEGSSAAMTSVEPMGMDAESIDRLAVRCCVLGAEADRRPAMKLVELLRTEFKAQSDFRYAVWDRESVIAGEKTGERQHEEICNADVVLQLISPAFIGDPSLKFKRNQTLAEIVPVALKPTADRQDSRSRR